MKEKPFMGIETGKQPAGEKRFIWLASASPRRTEILTQLGIEHEVLLIPSPQGPDEPQLRGESAAAYVQRTAMDKAVRAIAWLEAGNLPDNNPGRNEHRLTAPVLCADTTVILDGEVLGKPSDERHAREMLGRLSGRRHEVHTAVVLAHNGSFYRSLSISTVEFGQLGPGEIAEYCATGEPFGKAGSYAIQGRAAAFVKHLSGSHSGVMGLPAYETARLLEQCFSQARGTGAEDKYSN